ncbi:MAG: ABC transporter ATP-binding protein [Betaproteobacteria bacterium]|nr:ABC transporter ATP-binding protein [Betaproteobacteria bacterium]
MPNAHDLVIETRELTKEFLGFVAVKNVNLKVRRHSIHAIIGPNGAGKSTCFNLITKFHPPTTGTILFNGRDITQLSPSQIAREGLVRSFQISAVFPHLTALENVRIGLQRTLGTTFHFWKSDQTLNVLNDQAMQALEQVGLQDYAQEVAVNLPYGRKRALEIATTVAMNPEVMLLDEPTQGMGHEDVDRVTALIAKVAQGRTVLMVEHNMRVVSNIAHTISVLQRGELIAEGDYATVSSNPQVMEAYMGASDTELQGH